MTPQTTKTFVKPAIKHVPLQATNYIIVTADKGGVGKTATAVNLGAWLAKRNYKILIIDLDTRGDVSSSFDLKPEPGIYDAYIRERDPHTIIRPTRHQNLSVLPGDHWTGDVVALLDRRPEADRIIPLTRTMAEGFDFVIFDCPDKLGALRQRALELAGIIIVPQKPEPKGMPQIKHIMDLLRPEQVGIVLPTMTRRINIHGTILRRMMKSWPSNVIWTEAEIVNPEDPGNILSIPDSKFVSESEAVKQTLVEYAPDSPPSQAYLQLANRILLNCNYDAVLKTKATAEA
jgi:chromosome partitioning protein